MTSVIKQVPQKDSYDKLRLFEAAVNGQTTVPQKELIQNGISLMKTRPSSKDVVLEYFTKLFEKSIAEHMTDLENEAACSSNSQKPIKINHVIYEDAEIAELHGLIVKFINDTSTQWNLIISSWALTSLGILSKKYSDRGRAPVKGGLSDSLQQWMSCPATRALVDINNYCFSIFNKSDDDNINVLITNMLDYCVLYTPYIDWAVAHFGSCYPSDVINRVLKWSLEDFCRNREQTNSQRMNSAIGILSHLSTSHTDEIKSAILTIFMWSLEDYNSTKVIFKKRGVIPFLLKISTSLPLLNIISSVILENVTIETFEKFIIYGRDWKSFAGGYDAMFELVVHLIFSSNNNASGIIRLMLQAAEYKNSIISSVGEELLEMVLAKLDQLTRQTLFEQENPQVPLLECLQKNYEWILPLLLNKNEKTSSTAMSLINIMGQDNNTNITATAICYILKNSKDDDNLAFIVKLAHGYKASQVLSPAIALALSKPAEWDGVSEEFDPHLLWTNITKLLKWETSGTLISLPIQEAVWDNLIVITEQLTNEKEAKIAHVTAEVIRRTIMTGNLQPGQHLTMSLVKATVAYFYICLTQTQDIEELKGMRTVNSLLTKLCQNFTGARTMAVRELLESALFRKPSILFGAVPEENVEIFEETSTSLLQENYKLGTASLFSQRHSLGLYAGIIGSGKRKSTPTCPNSEEKVLHNTTLLMSALRACCTADNYQNMLDSIIAIALLLVELISPDVMYNGLPWPEDEFCKVTVERDLFIRRVIDNTPLTWSLLSYIAFYRPALCYCSVILRAVMATLISQWKSASQQNKKEGQCIALIETTTKLLHLLTLSQLLPFPLSTLSDVITDLPPHHVVCVLRDCIWNYLRDHVPSPALFSRDPKGVMWRDPAQSKPPKQYTETLRVALLKSNSTKLSYLYHILFVPENIGDM